MLSKIIAVSVFFAVIFALAAECVATPWVTAESAVIAARDGTVVWSKGDSYKAPPASTAKVMSALVALEKADPNKWVTVSRRAAGQEPTRVGVAEGEKYRLIDLARACLVSSGNDTAAALAEGVCGSEAEFAEEMTRKARSLGARNTVFKRASGLPADGQVTTASDLVVIMSAALRSPAIVNAMKQKEIWIESSEGRKIQCKNHNRMLWDNTRPVFLKTGYTIASRHCYVGFIGEGGENGIFAFLTSKKPWPDVKSIADWSAKYTSALAINRRDLDESEIRDLQAKLTEAGFDAGAADGVFGPQTLEALIEFQKSMRLDPDGIAGPITRRALQVRKRR